MKQVTWLAPHRLPLAMLDNPAENSSALFSLVLSLGGSEHIESKIHLPSKVLHKVAGP